MARLADRLPENAEGEFYVDSSCIDCATCRNVAPGVFTYSNRAALTVVGRQPADSREEARAKMALVACPTSSIGTVHKLEVESAVRSFPEPIEDDVHYAGFAAESSFGASSYLIVRAGGNVLVDSPRAAKPLMDRIAALGGVAMMFLSHRDDVADHAKYASRFGCRRILHRADVGHGTRDVEQQLEGEAPIALASDLVAIPVPGHTRGSTALLYRNKFLFTGDHLWRSEDAEELHASHSVCWYSWAEQTRSMEKLLAYDFEWVLPGHGSRWHAPRAGTRSALEALVRKMKRA